MSVNKEPVVDPIKPTSTPNTYGLSVTNLKDQAYNQIAAMTVTKTDYWVMNMRLECTGIEIYYQMIMLW